MMIKAMGFSPHMTTIRTAGKQISSLRLVVLAILVFDFVGKGYGIRLENA